MTIDAASLADWHAYLDRHHLYCSISRAPIDRYANAAGRYRSRIWTILSDAEITLKKTGKSPEGVGDTADEAERDLMDLVRSMTLVRTLVRTIEHRGVSEELPPIE